jgi:hypothetical protein
MRTALAERVGAFSIGSASTAVAVDVVGPVRLASSIMAAGGAARPFQPVHGEVRRRQESRFIRRGQAGVGSGGSGR